MIVKNDKPLMAISYETRTLKMLRLLVNRDDPSLVVNRIDPKDFLLSSSDEYQYINLVTIDFAERKLISKILDDRNHDRFSFIDTDFRGRIYEECNFGPGCLIFPGAMFYYADIGKDVIIHGRVSCAEGTKIGDGCFLSGMATIAGDVTIGDFCFISTNVLIMDHVSICDDVRILPATNVRKSISSPGTYWNPYSYKVEKMRKL